MKILCKFAEGLVHVRAGAGSRRDHVKVANGWFGGGAEPLLPNV